MANKIIDVVGGHHLTLAGTPDQGKYGMTPYVAFDGVDNYAYRPAEALKGVNGFTAGGWFQVSSDAVLMGTWHSPSNRGWQLFMSTLVPTFYTSNNGSTTFSVAHPASLSTSVWYSMAVRHTPSTEMAIFINNVKTVNTTGIPTAIYDSPAVNFAIGGFPTGFASLVGKASMCWMCSEVLDDAHLTMLFETSRHLFSV